MPTILVTEDDTPLRETLLDHLRDEGYEAIGASTASEMRAVLASRLVDLALLDLGLPDEDGLVLSIELRRRCPHLALIMVTGRDRLADRVSGLRLGADAYVVKPFQFAELSAVIESVLRRTCQSSPRQPGPSASHRGAWILDIGKWQVAAPEGKTSPIKLSAGEFHFLRTLAEAPGHQARRVQLIDAVSANPANYDPRNLDALLRRLRRKVEAAAGIAIPIQAVHAQGYAFTGRIELV